MKAIWNERYQQENYQYGIKPNDFFAEELSKLKSGRILVPGAGEGRDAVYAAKLGWEVHAFDLSEQGEAKANRLASAEKVRIHYKVADAGNVKFPLESFDVIALTFFHLPLEIRLPFYKQCISWLKPGGKIIMEGFNKRQIGLSSGGPKQLEWLFSSAEIAAEFPGLTINKNEELQRNLDEGPLHQGKAEVNQFIGQKL
ncbi:class I SAM-dependent methyltransferase [Aquirufa antheringensis]